MIVFDEFNINTSANTITLKANLKSEYRENFALDTIYIYDTPIDFQNAVKTDFPSSNYILKYTLAIDDGQTYAPVNYVQLLLGTTTAAIMPSTGDYSAENLITIDSTSSNFRVNTNTFNNKVYYCVITCKVEIVTPPETEDSVIEKLPCEDKKMFDVVFTYYKGNIYNTIMSYVNELSDNCSIPKNFIDQILRYKALQMATNTGDTINVEKYFRIWGINTGSNVKSNCGCHG